MMPSPQLDRLQERLRESTVKASKCPGLFGVLAPRRTLLDHNRVCIAVRMPLLSTNRGHLGGLNSSFYRLVY